MNDHRSSSFSSSRRRSMGSILNSLNNLFVRAPACRLRLIDGDGMDGVGHEGVAPGCARACALRPAPWALRRARGCRGGRVDGPWTRAGEHYEKKYKYKSTKVIHYNSSTQTEKHDREVGAVAAKLHLDTSTSHTCTVGTYSTVGTVPLLLLYSYKNSCRHYQFA